ncbi:MAG: fused MFS/spermidine synthase [Anaerolineae bacterium]|nr:MAG: fused MFS/spermidine synthase [Anaerolineae bacterium]
MKPGRAYLLLTVFTSGMTTLAVELSASRLLDPYFGNSNLVWANLIGLILVTLTAGYYLGGRLADRFPRPAALYQIVAWAAFLVGLVPFAARPLLSGISGQLTTAQVDVLVGSFVGVLALLALPVTLLGCVSPFAIRLAMRHVGQAGHVAGGIYALSTLGSILGTFLPPLVLVPAFGTRATFLIFAATLLLVALGGLFRAAPRLAAAYLLLPLALLALALLLPGGVVKAAEGLVYETESAYNYIQVVDWDRRYLLLNEGQGVHSVYDPENLATYGTWDFFLVAPFFNPPPYTPDQVDSLCLIGLAAGTVSKQYTAVFGHILIDGVEIDPQIVRVGREYFDMTEPNLNTVVADGRAFLAHTGRRYDVVGIDAYRLPYVPWHLTTVEFFRQVRDHLTGEGVVAVNVGHTDTDWRLVEAMVATLGQVFPSVHVINVHDTFNAVVVATVQSTEATNLAANLPGLTHPLLVDAAGRALADLRAIAPGELIFTDDKAPVEYLTNLVVLRYFLFGE